MSKRYSLFQLNLTKEERDAVNAKGWDGAAKEFPRVTAYLEVTMRGAKGYKDQYQSAYSHVADIEAKDLEDVFRVGNIGPEEQIDRIAPMHSVSVGDLVKHNHSGKVYIVDSFGFEQV